jgi:NADPH:quinone reductase-like Zn-dependent oxidoreductase
MWMPNWKWSSVEMWASSGQDEPARLPETAPLPRPDKVPVLGMDVAGRVEAVGAQVTRFQPGDEVFGWTNGSFAEYAVAPEDHLAAKPAALSFEEAAVVPISGFAALQAVRDVGEVQAGQKVLVLGAAGAVGWFAVQLAKAFDAQVTGVASTSQLELVRSIGADEVIDYTREDVTDGTRQWEVIVDTGGRRTLSQLRQALTPTGTLVIVGGGGADGGWVGSSATCGPPLVSRFVGQRLRMLSSKPNQKDLQVLRELIEAGKLRPLIGGTYHWVRPPRPYGPWKQATVAARSSSPSEARTTAQITRARSWNSATAGPSVAGERRADRLDPGRLNTSGSARPPDACWPTTPQPDGGVDFACFGIRFFVGCALIISWIIQTIVLYPSGAVWTDEASNVSRLDPSRADQADAKHPTRNRKVVGSNPSSGSASPSSDRMRGRLIARFACLVDEPIASAPLFRSAIEDSAGDLFMAGTEVPTDPGHPPLMCLAPIGRS